MKFNLVDRIVELEAGRRIRVTKCLSLAEEYLADHFETFPVMPGVLMLECMGQAAAWLVRATEEFAHSLVEVCGVKNVVYKSFVIPGQTLTVDVECKRLEPDGSEFVGWGRCDDVEVVKARLFLKHLNLSERQPALAHVDAELVDQARRQFALIGGGVFVSWTPWEAETSGAASFE